MSYLELSNVNKSFGSGTAKAEVLSDINLSVRKGEFVAILGYSGTFDGVLGPTRHRENDADIAHGRPHVTRFRLGNREWQSGHGP